MDSCRFDNTFYWGFNKLVGFHSWWGWIIPSTKKSFAVTLSWYTWSDGRKCRNQSFDFFIITSSIIPAISDLISRDGARFATITFILSSLMTHSATLKHKINYYCVHLTFVIAGYSQSLPVIDTEHVGTRPIDNTREVKLTWGTWNANYYDVHCDKEDCNAIAINLISCYSGKRLVKSKMIESLEGWIYCHNQMHVNECLAQSYIRIHAEEIVEKDSHSTIYPFLSGEILFISGPCQLWRLRFRNKFWNFMKICYDLRW